jgi:hypothetical protein
MTNNNINIILLRTVHGLFALYFIFCILYIFYAAITLDINLLLAVAIASLFIEGFLVFILNGGNCPLFHIQKRLNDPVPFFNLFLSDSLAKKAIPFFTLLMLLGLLLLAVRILQTSI